MQSIGLERTQLKYRILIGIGYFALGCIVSSYIVPYMMVITSLLVNVHKGDKSCNRIYCAFFGKRS